MKETMRETAISREEALEYLEKEGLEDEWDPAGDYFFIFDEETGDRFLTRWGYDEPEIRLTAKE